MKKFFPWILAGIFFVVGVATLKDYGMNWDEPARLLRGQAFLQFFLTGRGTANLPDRTPPNLIRPYEFVTRYNFSASERQTMATLPPMPRPQAEFAAIVTKFGRRFSFYQHDAWSAYFMKYDPFETGHLPLPELLGSMTNRVLYQAWGIAGDIESYHIPYVLLAGAGVFVVSAFAIDATGSWFAGLVAGLSLALFPVFFAEAHFNMKDPAVAALFAGCVWMFWRWVRENKLTYFFGFVVFFALSLGVKWNAVFLPFIFGPWLLSIRKTAEFRRWYRPKKLLLLFCVAAGACVIFMLGIWPVSWGRPLVALWDLVQYYWGIGTGSSGVQPAGFIFPPVVGVNFYPFLLFLAQTPEVLLFLSAVGYGCDCTRCGGENPPYGIFSSDMVYSSCYPV